MNQYELMEVESVRQTENYTSICYKDGREFREYSGAIETMETLCHQAGKSIYLMGKLTKQLGVSQIWDRPGLVCISPALIFVPMPLDAGFAYINLARILGICKSEGRPAVTMQSGQTYSVNWTMIQFAKRWKNLISVRERYLSVCRNQLALAEILHV